jgi:hypothetical protein
VKDSVRTALVVLFLIVVVLFAPFAYHFDLGPGPDSIDAVMWHYLESSWYTGFRLQDPLRYFPYVIFRLLFVLQFIRYWQGKSSDRITLLVAAYSEIHVGLLSLPVYISWFFELGVFLSAGGDPLLPVFFPIPLLFLATLILVLLNRRGNWIR